MLAMRSCDEDEFGDAFDAEFDAAFPPDEVMSLDCSRVASPGLIRCLCLYPRAISERRPPTTWAGQPLRQPHLMMRARLASTA